VEATLRGLCDDASPVVREAARWAMAEAGMVGPDDS
jgi:hypothetical protein